MAVYKESDTNTWRVIYRYTDWMGERKQTSKRGFPTKRDALAWEREQLQKVKADLDMTFESFVETYTVDMQSRIKENTWETKEHIIRTKLLPYFGKRKICEIQPKEIIAWQNEMINSKKWASPLMAGEDGQKRRVYSYSLLQDRYFEHMRKAGFIGFERGERGSTTEHLDVLDYKMQQENARLDVLNQEKEKKQKQLVGMERQLGAAQPAAIFATALDNMPKKTVTGKVALSPADWSTVYALAKEGLRSRAELVRLNDAVQDERSLRLIYKRRYDELEEETRDYRIAVRFFPQQVKTAMDSIHQLIQKQKEEERNRPFLRASYQQQPKRVKANRKRWER